MIELNLNPPVRQLRQFGWIALFGFPLVGILLGLGPIGNLGTTFFYVMLGVGAVMGAGAALGLAWAIRPVYVVMTVIAWPIGMVVSTVLMALVFYGMFTPVGLLFRVLGRDPLNRKIEPSTKSYWIPRRGQRRPESYLRLY